MGEIVAQQETGNYLKVKCLILKREQYTQPFFFRIVIFLVEIACPLIKTSSEKPDS